MRNLLIYHLVPFSISALLIGFSLLFISCLGLKPQEIKPELIHVSGASPIFRGYNSNLTTENNQANLAFSFKANNLTIFGSSEFNSSPYCPYFFLPDSSGIRAFGVGQGFHQSLSIFAECLAFEKEIEGKSITLILSPGWFESNGTNANSFIKFADKNLLNRIILNSNIPKNYTEYLGKYIYENQDEMESLSYQMEFLKTQYQNKLPVSISSLFGEMNQKIRDVIPVSYSFDTVVYLINDTSKTLSETKENVDYDIIEKSLRTKFINSVTNNPYFVNDDYYSKYMKGGGKRFVKPLYLSNNELADFEILVDFLTEKNVKLSVVMQPLNPYFYDNLEAMNPILDKVNSVLDEKEIPFLNLFTTETKNYEPGTLTDIMHFGNLGWTKVNSFLDSLNHE
ncbi:MAG: D-alanyl-lipoteichoic acid biosynthesis protein DltD [Flavobacteriales bacterium]